jgi:hypothetical protein
LEFEKIALILGTHFKYNPHCGEQGYFKNMVLATWIPFNPYFEVLSCAQFTHNINLIK